MKILKWGKINPVILSSWERGNEFQMDFINLQEDMC
jgi:hypothetical protein